MRRLDFYLFLPALHITENRVGVFKMKNFKDAVVSGVHIFQKRHNFQSFFLRGSAGIEPHGAAYSEPLPIGGTGANFNFGVGFHLLEHVFVVVCATGEFPLVDHYKAHGPYPRLILLDSGEKKRACILQKFQNFFHNKYILMIISLESKPPLTQTIIYGDQGLGTGDRCMQSNRVSSTR